MDKVATMSAEQRRELFLESANQRGMNPAIMEKDFWVCWVLKHLFAHEEIGPHMVFKGGTSLSKVFGLIERFSEDIDLILDWRLIGYGDNGIDVHQDFTSNARRNTFNQEVNKKAANYIQVQLIPQLQ